MTMIYIGAYRLSDGNEELIAASSEPDLQKAISDLAAFCGSPGYTVLFEKAFLFTELQDIIELADPGGKLRLFDGIEGAIKYGESMSSAVSVIKHLSDPEDACKEFLDRKGYYVSVDRETAVEELAAEGAVASAGHGTTHDQYAADVVEKTATLARKYGWLKVLEALETLEG